MPDDYGGIPLDDDTDEFGGVAIADAPPSTAQERPRVAITADTPLPDDPNDPNFNPGLPPRMTESDLRRAAKESKLGEEVAGTLAEAYITGRLADFFEPKLPRNLLAPTTEEFLREGEKFRANIPPEMRLPPSPFRPPATVEELDPATRQSLAAGEAVSGTLADLSSSDQLLLLGAAAATGGLPGAAGRVSGAAVPATFGVEGVKSITDGIKTLLSDTATPEERGQAKAQIGLGATMLPGFGALLPRPTIKPAVRAAVERVEARVPDALNKSKEAVIEIQAKTEPTPAPAPTAPEVPKAEPVAKPESAETLPTLDDALKLNSTEQAFEYGFTHATPEAIARLKEIRKQVGEQWKALFRASDPAADAMLPKGQFVDEAIQAASRDMDRPVVADWLKGRESKSAVPTEQFEVSVQAPDGEVPGYVQIVDRAASSENVKSPTVESLKAAGVDVPDFSKLPTGKYTWKEASEKAKVQTEPRMGSAGEQTPLGAGGKPERVQGAPSGAETAQGEISATETQGVSAIPKGVTTPEVAAKSADSPLSQVSDFNLLSEARRLRKAGADDSVVRAEMIRRREAPEPTKAVEPVGAEPVTYASQAKAIADKLREQFKTDTGGKTFTGPVEIINAAVEVAAKIIEYGGSAADAMAAALKHIKENWKGEFDEVDFRTKFEKAIAVPDTAGETVKMRKSAERAVESPMIPKEVQERIRTAEESTFKQQSGDKVEDAVKALSDSELAAMPVESNLFVAARLERAVRDFAKGEMDAGYNVFVELEKQGTSFGQNVNQFKRLKGTIPEYVAFVIDKKLTASGKDALTPAQRTDVVEIARKSKEADAALDKATDAWQAKPTDANAAKAETALDRANAEAIELQKFVAKFQPRSTASVLKSVLQGNLLTPISEVANLFGNMSFLIPRAVGRTGATAYDIINSYIRDVPRTRTVQPISGTIEAAKGVARGLKQIPDILIEGTGDVIKGETRAGLHPIKAWVNQFAKNPEMPTTGGRLTLKDRLNLAIEGTFGVPAEAMLRGLGAGDVPFREAARARVTAEQLRLNGVPRDQWAFAQKFPELFLPRNALEQIHKDTMSAIFQGESKTLNAITNWLRGKGEVVDLIAATVAPYKLTPWNIIGETLSYNPAIAMARGIRDASKGNSRGAADNAGKMVVGALLTGTGVWLYKNGLLAPSLDERDEAQKARVLSGKVLPPNHINISGLKRAMEGGDPAFKAGDETADVFRAGGLAGAMFYMTANIGRDMERGPEASDADMWKSIIRNSTLEQARFGLNQSFLSGVEGLLTAIKEGKGDTFLRQWANTVASIALPNTLNTISRASRKYQNDVKADFPAQIKSKLGIFGLGDYLPLKRDFWGKPMLETPEGRDAIFYHFFDITKNKQVTSDPVELELYRLWRKTSDTSVIPSLPQRTVTLGGSSYALDPKQYERYAELVGENRRQIVDALVINPNFHKLDDEAKIKLLERVYRDGMERGKALFAREFQGQLQPKAGRAGFR